MGVGLTRGPAGDDLGLPGGEEPPPGDPGEGDFLWSPTSELGVDVSLAGLWGAGEPSSGPLLSLEGDDPESPEPLRSLLLIKEVW